MTELHYLSATDAIERFRSRDEEAFSDRLLAVMRNKFGGHALKKS